MQVYLIHMIGTDFYKIGYTSRHISKRLSEIQVGCPGELQVYATYESKLAPQIETAMHNRLSYKRSSGEWFSLESDEARKFKEMCASIEDGIKILMENGNPFVRGSNH